MSAGDPMGKSLAGFHSLAEGHPPTRDRLVLLVVAAQGGSQSAFASLIRHYHRMLRAVANRYVPRSEVEDLVQDSVLAAFFALPTLRDPRKFGGWIRAVVLRTASKRLRHRAFEAKAIAEYRCFELTTKPSPCPPETTLDVLRAHRTLSTAGCAPQRGYHALWLRAVEGYTMPEAASILGMAQASVKRREKDAIAHVTAVFGDVAVP